MKDKFVDYIHFLQDQICSRLENLDGKEKFKEDLWTREGGGGGKTRILSNGDLVEKGGVNTSIVHGKLSPLAQKQLKVEHEDFFACGISLVIHPLNPMVPTIHMNVRYFELYDLESNIAQAWFGGGIDLTPYYLWEEDAIFFHKQLKSACDPFGEELYPQFKKQCDEYFYNTHRSEMRGIGGIFFDYLKKNEAHSLAQRLNFTKAIGDQFIPVYTEIVGRRKNESWEKEQKEWQEIRRGRYVEFNLLHDRGTHFGIKTNGRTESILMSLPPTVRWEYDHHPKPLSREEHLVHNLQPRDWAELAINI
ncbi:MAG: oxygen-dependent coproporphyrinogen oxidase [Bacteroidota bacterium]